MTPVSTATPAEARFDILVATLDNTLISTGESVQIALQVENTGEQDDTFQANLTVNSESVDSKSVTVEADEERTIVFNYQFDEPGEYEIAVADTSLGPLTVTAASDDGTVTARPGDDADGTRTSPIEVTDATAPADWVKKGYEATVRATVVNTANRTANRILTVTVDDRPVANETVRLQPYEREVVTVEFEAVGGTVAVEGVDAGRISIGERYGAVETDTDEDDTDDGGLGLALGIGALTVIALVLTGVVVSSRTR
jgi:hypothetical protein